MERSPFQKLIQWLRRSLHLSPTSRITVKIIEQWHEPGIIALRLKDTTIPGFVDLWRLNRDERARFFLLVISTRYLDQDLALQGLSRNNFCSIRAGRCYADLQSQLQEQMDVAATHYWIVGWDKDFTAVDPYGQRYRSRRIDRISVYALDLEGAIGSIGDSDRFAKGFSRQIAKKLFKGEFREFREHSRWETAVNAIDWLGWLEGLAHRYIDPNHVLQPRKGGGGGRKE